MDLRNKAVLITGGKRIGVAVAADLARQGMDVAVVYRRSREEAEAVVKDVEGFAATRAFPCPGAIVLPGAGVRDALRTQGGERRPAQLRLARQALSGRHRRAGDGDPDAGLGRTRSM